MIDKDSRSRFLIGCFVAALAVWSFDSFAQATAVDADAEQALIKIKSEFAALKLAAYSAVISAALIGLLVFFLRRRKLATYPRWWGLGATTVSSVAIFVLLATVLGSAEGKACASAALEVGNAAKDYDDICRAARESLANTFGFASLFRKVFVSAGSAYVVPIAVGIVNFLTYLSVVVAAMILFLIGRPFIEKFLIRV